MANIEKAPRGWRFVPGITVCAIALLLGVSCSVSWLGQTAWQPPQLVSVEGQKCFSVIYWHGLKNFFIPLQQGGAFSVPIRNNDFLFTEGENLVPYRDSDGQSLVLAGDKDRAVLNGNTVSLKLIKNEAWKWIQKATPEELKELRLLNIGDNVNARQITQLKRIARVNPRVGLWVDNGTWRRIATLFDPVCLMISGLQEQDWGILTKKKSLRTLHIGSTEHSLNFLSKMPGLETLIIDDWEPQKTGPLPDNLTSLRRLVLIDPVFDDLSALGKQPRLLELNIHESKTLTDLTLLNRFPELRLLSLVDNKKIQDLGPLKKLKSLQWLSMPRSTTQEQLVEIIQSRPDLVFLDLSDCEKITDLAPIENLPKLRYLMVPIGKPKPGPLYEMKHLKWLAVAGENDDIEKVEMKNLQEALPDTVIVRVVPFCLGSGWIILLLPVIAGSWWLTRRRERLGLFLRGDHG